MTDVGSTIGCSGKKIPHFLGGKGGLSQLQSKIQIPVKIQMKIQLGIQTQIQIIQAKVQKFFFCRK